MSDEGLLIRGGEVIDGTGTPAFRADVRVRDGRIVEVGPDLEPDSETVLDASGAFVAPGFIDTHAHTDPQVFWDPTLDPDPLHGVTTMLVGNCSLSLYPASERTRTDISDLFAYIEDVPRFLFDENVPWTWTDYAGYRDTVNATGAAANLAALGYKNVEIQSADGYAGWPQKAPFDAIVVAATAPRVPPALVEQLKPGGRMVIPVGDLRQELKLVTKRADGGYDERDVLPVRFVPLVRKA